MGNFDFYEIIYDFSDLLLALRYNNFEKYLEYFCNVHKLNKFETNFFFAKYLNEFGKYNIVKILQDKLMECKKYETSDDKKISINLLTTREDLPGISFELFTLDESNYSKYVEISKEDVKNNYEIISISFTAKKDYEIKEIMNFFEKRIPILKCNPLIKNCLLTLRSKGKKVILDYINSKDDNFYEVLLFMNFKAIFKTEMNIEDFLKLQEKDWIKKASNFNLAIDGKVHYFISLLSSLIEILQKIHDSSGVEFRKKETLDLIQKLNYLKAYLSFSFDLELNNKEIASFINNYLTLSLQHLKDTFKSILINHYFESIKQFGDEEAYKALDFNEISFNLFSPKFKTGIAGILKLPGMNNFIMENL